MEYPVQSTITFLERVKQHALTMGSEIAVSRRVVGGSYELTTWRELAESGCRAATYLSNSRGHFVPIISAKSSQNIAAIIGALAAGKAFVSLNPKLRLPQIVDALAVTDASHAVIDVDLLRLIDEAVTEPAVVATEWLVIGDATKSERHVGRLRDAGVKLSIFQDIGGEPQIEAHPFAHGVPACCLFTSGSTGTPKGVLIDHVDLVGRAEAEREWFSLAASDVSLSVLPLSFDVGLAQLLGALWVGCEICIIPSWLPADIVAAVRERKVTAICGVPSIWQDFLKSTAPEPEDIASLRYITISGGSLPESQLPALVEMFEQIDVYKTYGQTEDFRSSSLIPSDLFRKPGSVGKPYLGVELKIVDPDGNECKPGVIGEVVHTGLGQMLGYLGGNGSDGKLRSLPGSDRLGVYTGDLGHLDEEGYLYLHGRSDFMAKVAGNRVFPAEIANQIAKFPEVAEVQVVIVPDVDGAAIVHAFLVARPGRALDTTDLRKKLRNLLPTYMLPQQVIILPMIPRTPTGKPDLALLAAWAKDNPIAITS